MATIDLKLKTYEQLQFEVMNLNTKNYLQQQELDKYKNIVDKTNWWLEEMLKQAKSEETKAIINGTLDLLLKGE